MDWLNIPGLIIVLLMLVPNIVYALSGKGAVNKCTSPVMNLIEQVGRYGSMFLMSFNIGFGEQGFISDKHRAIWLWCSAILMCTYWLLWVFYIKHPGMALAVLLAVIPSILFILSGLLQRHWPLVALGCFFCVGHIYVTVINNL